MYNCTKAKQVIRAQRWTGSQEAKFYKEWEPNAPNYTNWANWEAIYIIYMLALHIKQKKVEGIRVVVDQNMK